MTARLLRTATFSLLTVALLAGGAPSSQSGRATMSGYVSFEDVSYLDAQEKHIHATVELRRPGDAKPAYSAETDDHGLYSFVVAALGEFTLRISSPGYKDYTTTIYLPSDFQCHLGTLLKKAGT